VRGFGPVKAAAIARLRPKADKMLADICNDTAP